MTEDGSLHGEITYLTRFGEDTTRAVAEHLVNVDLCGQSVVTSWGGVRRDYWGTAA